MKDYGYAVLSILGYNATRMAWPMAIKNGQAPSLG